MLSVGGSDANETLSTVRELCGRLDINAMVKIRSWERFSFAIELEQAQVPKEFKDAHI